ncbi:MAG TPA: carboxypeptidase regulatory-like domain-containing protein [Leptolinea sp.]
MHLFTSLSRIRQIVIAMIIGGILISACESDTSKGKSTQTASTHPDVLASFFVELSEPLPANSQLSLEWVDPLNAHQLNPSYQAMQPVDELHYQLDVPSKKGTLLQYRFIQTGKANEIEVGADGQVLPSRFFYIINHSRIQDKILGFTASISSIPLGRMEGTLLLKGSGQPAAGAIVTVSGISTTTSVDGKFKLEGVPAGTQNVTVFSPAGDFEPFEQQAIIEEKNVTPMDVELNTRKLVNVTFIVTTPKGTPPLAALYLFGNLTSMGDSFAGLFGGTSLIQNRAPRLTKQSENEYLVVLQLPVDTEIHYLYSLGDTFWNSETSQSGQANRRSFFVSRQDMEIEDKVEAWITPNFKPVSFKFAPPASTHATDRIQIQFNAYGWMDPLDMWPVGDGTYEFTLVNPLNFSAPVNYRFCRSEMCGTTDPQSQQEQQSSFSAAPTEQVFQTIAGQWSLWIPNLEPTTVTTETSLPRDSGFHAIVEMTDSYRPSWLAYFDSGLDGAIGLNANTVILPVTWTFRSASPVWLANNLSQDPSIEDIRAEVSRAKEKGLQVYLLAETRYPTTAVDFWDNFSSDPTGWDQWFIEITNFYRSTAQLALTSKADGLILGDEAISQIIGKTNDVPGIMDKYPDNANDRWQGIFSEIRSLYTGESFLALNFNDLNGPGNLPLDRMDGIYLLNLGRVAESTGDTKVYSEQIARKLNDVLEPFFADSGKKAWLGVDFPSVVSSYLGCVEFAEKCMIPSALNFPAPIQPDLALSMQEQANLYNAVLPEINRRSWVDGVSTRRYLITSSNQDQSSSIRGKPAADIVWYWYASYTGKPTQ